MYLLNRSSSFASVLAASSLSLIVLSGCSRELANTDLNNGLGNRVADAGTDATAAKRLCTDKVSQYTALSVSRYFGGIAVRGLESAPTFCLNLAATGSKVTGSLRVEFEDDFGIKNYFAAEVTNTFFGELKQTATGFDLYVIFVDNFGLIEVSAHADGSGPMNGTIRSYDFPTYDEALNTEVEKIRLQCKNAGKPGYPTVANCLGYNYPPTFWWNQPAPTSTYDKQLADAKVTLADTSKTFKLGNISFDLGTVLSR